MSIFLRAFRAYDRSLQTRPIVTKSLTSGCTFSLADFLCQKIAEKGDEHDLRRTLHMGLIGLASGPIFHFWNQYLKGLRLLQAWRPVNAALYQSFLDSTMFRLPYTTWFLFQLKWLNSGDAEQGARYAKNRIGDTLYQAYKVWPLAQFLNFYFVPLPYRVLFSNMVGLVWNVALSYISHKNIELMD